MHNGSSQGILKLRLGGKTIDPTRVTRFAGCARREKHPAFIPFEGALMKIRWRRWYVFDKIDLNDSNYRDISGVYVIAYWNGEDEQITVKVGRGCIWSRIKSHRENPIIQGYGRAWTLYITWAEIPTQNMDGVEKYLAEVLHPIVSERFPDTHSTPVNLPSSSRPQY